MRLWSIHPQYLDARGLVALWREGLLARKVLRGLTKGYKHHPQLERFMRCTNRLAVIDRYLLEVHKESIRRGYNFDKKKIGKKFARAKMNVSKGQISFEFQHLRKKLQIRDRRALEALPANSAVKSHPLFRVVRGKVESWERI